MRIFIAGLACVILSIVLDTLFLPHQSLWNDEATQLDGLTLDPVEVTRWLAGRVDHDFGVPDDRMPPLSYIAGWGWMKAFGFGERPMRWFGICCTAVATLIVFASATRAWGLASGVAAALLLATSPNMVTSSVEIRAYPMLLMTSSALFACLIGYAVGPLESRRRWLAGMLVLGVVGMYTHFFGLVAFGGAFVGAFVLAVARREKILPVIVMAALTGVLAVGLGPFVFASSDMSPAVPMAYREKLTVVIRLIYRLFAHPAMAVNVVPVACAGLGFGLAMVGGAVPKLRSGWASIALIAAIGSGFLVVSLAQMVVSSFAPAASHYNIWMVPVVSLLAGSGLAARSRALRASTLAGVLLLLAAHGYATYQLNVHGDLFAHTPMRFISALIRQYPIDEVGVIHDSDDNSIWTIQSPARYEFGPELHQFVPLKVAGDSAVTRVLNYPGKKVETPLDALPFRCLIVIRAHTVPAKDIASQIHGGLVPLGDGPTVRALLASRDWERVDQKEYLSFVSVDVDIFRKVVRP
jgi:hypothetical protein